MRPLSTLNKPETKETILARIRELRENMAQLAERIEVEHEKLAPLIAQWKVGDVLVENPRVSRHPRRGRVIGVSAHAWMGDKVEVRYKLRQIKQDGSDGLRTITLFDWDHRRWMLMP